MSAAALFDRLAARYDELWTDTPAGRAQRNAVWRAVDPLFRAGDRILDIGCGTGEDAAHFAGRGAIVHAVDRSGAMVEQARGRGGFTVRQLAAEDLGVLRPCVFDGAISNFGALNCVEDLPAVGLALAPLVRPGGFVAICIIGRFCAWETLYYGVRLNFRKAFRRLPGRSGEIRYPTVRKIRDAFAPAFELRRWTGIGMLVPPSYVKLPAKAIQILERLDRAPWLRSLADHRLAILVRK